jgi:hypothetical protein
MSSPTPESNVSPFALTPQDRIVAKCERHDTYNRIFGDGGTLRDTLVAAMSRDGGCQEKGNKHPS